jgi:hypothetical protein
VYRARDLTLDRVVALKMIQPRWLSDPMALARFLVEAQAVARLEHPNIVRVWESGEAEGQPYLALEFIGGGSLAARRREGPCPPRVAAHLVAQLADAMEYAHREGVIHRDLKPANILLQPVSGEGRLPTDSLAAGRVPLTACVPRIADFGLARLLEREAARTLPGARLGTPPYAAPEQAEGRTEAVGPATDIFGLGAILYDLLTGSPPWQGTTPEEVLAAARAGRVTPPRQLNPRVPLALEQICLKALAADPQQRQPSAAALAADLRRYLGRRRRWVLAAVVCACLCVLGTLAMALAGALGRPEVPLSGDLVVRLWSPDGGGKHGVRVEDPGALPARHGDRVHLEARLNQSAYVYLLWVDGEGKVRPLYPWNNDLGLNASPPEQAPRAVVFSPMPHADGRNKGWKLDHQDGLETVLLLASRTPLPRDVDLGRLIGQLPPTPVRDPLEVAVRGFDQGRPVGAIDWGEHRGIEREAADLDAPLLEVMTRLRGHFEMVRAVRFAHQGR